MARAESLYISASTNRHSHAASVTASSLVAFASQKSIALWDSSDPIDAGVSLTLPGHKAEVNCVKITDDDVIFSGDQNGVLQVRIKKSGNWKVVIEHTAHAKSISALAIHGSLVVTGSSDATIKVWKFTLGSKSKGLIEHIQTLDMNGRFPLDVQLTSFPETSCLILAIASTSRDVHIWSGSETQFVHSASLSGHEDWVKSIAFTTSRHTPPQLTLASASQDGTIRLWTVDRIIFTRSDTAAKDELFDAFETSLDDFSEGEEGGRQISTKRHVIAIKNANGNVLHFALIFDALLMGHEAAVTSVSWRPELANAYSLPTLLSTSVDSSLILWSPSSLSNTSDVPGSMDLWINRQRFGDVGGQRLGGFVGGIWAADGREALAWGWNGGWRRWRCEGVRDGFREVWAETGALTGHQSVVKSIAWSSSGEYLLSTGLDQTTRIHGPHRPHNLETLPREVWHELARPQVHGYDIVGAEFFSSLRFVSISDEKVARVFDAPKNFVITINALGTTRKQLSVDDRPAGANVPPLGLSNKATNDAESHEGVAMNQSVASRYPFEGELASTTLWPEIEKIYGHGYELISVAVSHSGSIFVTGCKSSTTEHAMLRVYNAKDWQLVGNPLEGHSLTVTRVKFSPDDDLILSVSRDRAWRLFRRNLDNGDYVPWAMEKSHGRIIWDCTWTHEVSETAFATASRDKTVKIWRPMDASLSRWSAIATIKFKEAATAVDFGPLLHDGRRRLAIGLESGEISIYSSKSNALHEWKLEITLDPLLSHVDSVHRVLWRPTENLGEMQQLATCSEDHTIKVMIVHLDFD